MKKVLVLIVLLLNFILFGCSQDSGSDKLMISIYYEGTNDGDCAIELYNDSENDINLNNYYLEIYKSYNDEPKTRIALTDYLIKAKDVFVIVYEAATDELKAHADILNSDLYFRGSESIALTYKSSKLDVVGSVGYEFVYGKDTTYVRKVDRVIPTTIFDEYDWIKYNADDKNYFGEFINSVTPEEFLAGPMLDSIYINNEDYPFVASNNSVLGGGGATKVSLYKNVDGDTAYYFFDEMDIMDTNVKENNIMNVSGKIAGKVRYQDINTPESYYGNIQEFGLYAKEKVGTLQNNAKEIYVQSVKNNNMLCTYGRILGYVFVDGMMVNYYVIVNGLSTITYNSKEVCYLSYKGVPYSAYFINAREYAKRNKLGLYGEKDPYWDYTNNKVKAQYEYGINI